MSTKLASFLCLRTLTPIHEDTREDHRRQEKLTLGQASEFAGMSQLEFQRLLASQQIAIHYGVQEFADDLVTLRRLGQL